MVFFAQIFIHGYYSQLVSKVRVRKEEKNHELQKHGNRKRRTDDGESSDTELEVNHKNTEIYHENHDVSGERKLVCVGVLFLSMGLH